ncbi:MAG: hypothetical protein LBI20_02275 [Holosporales bacterium]|jgi:hypothetical protein|nr:hypothetical protein [Holosporales bacterium]
MIKLFTKLRSAAIIFLALAISPTQSMQTSPTDAPAINEARVKALIELAISDPPYGGDPKIIYSYATTPYFRVRVLSIQATDEETLEALTRIILDTYKAQGIRGRTREELTPLLQQYSLPLIRMDPSNALRCHGATLRMVQAGAL